jgi:formate dehydrogenase accessory protein FdhD
MYTEVVKIKQVKMGEGSNIIEDKIAKDTSLCIFINDIPYRTLISTPGKEKELSLGHIFNEGLISSLDEIKNIEITKDKVKINTIKEIDINNSEVIRHRLITTACGVTDEIDFTDLEKLKISKRKKIYPETIFDSVKKLNQLSKIFKETGGTHSALLKDTKSEFEAYAEDVSRHNALDKVIGAGLIQSVDFSNCILSTSGRLSGEMIIKAARAQTPVVCSMSAPLKSGITVAKKVGITLFGFVRGRRLNQYTFLND